MVTTAAGAGLRSDWTLVDDDAAPVATDTVALPTRVWGAVGLEISCSGEFLQRERERAVSYVCLMYM